MAFTLTNLFNKIGDNKLQMQLLDQVFVEFKKRRDYNEVTFCTQKGLSPQAQLLGNGPPMADGCLIVWFERAHLDALRNTKTPSNLQLYQESESRLRNLYLALKGVAGTPGAKVFEQDECLIQGLLDRLEPIFGEEG